MLLWPSVHWKARPTWLIINKMHTGHQWLGSAVGFVLCSSLHDSPFKTPPFAEKGESKLNIMNYGLWLRFFLFAEFRSCLSPHSNVMETISSLCVTYRLRLFFMVCLTNDFSVTQTRIPVTCGPTQKGVLLLCLNSWENCSDLHNSRKSRWGHAVSRSNTMG